MTGENGCNTAELTAHRDSMEHLETEKVLCYTEKRNSIQEMQRCIAQYIGMKPRTALDCQVNRECRRDGSTR